MNTKRKMKIIEREVIVKSLLFIPSAKNKKHKQIKKEKKKAFLIRNNVRNFEITSIEY